MNKIIFSGLVVLVCCFFGGVGVVNGETDIGGQCFKIDTPIGGSITPNDICQAAGHGPCEEVAGSIIMFQNDDCTGTAYLSTFFTNCAAIVSEPMTMDRESAKIVRSGPIGPKLICGGIRGWGVLMTPKNVPDDFSGAVASATNWLLGFVSMLAVLMIIWGGINYLTAAGDEEKARTAKKIITYGIIGIVIAGLAYAIVTVIVVTILK